MGSNLCSRIFQEQVFDAGFDSDVGSDQQLQSVDSWKLLPKTQRRTTLKQSLISMKQHTAWNNSYVFTISLSVYTGVWSRLKNISTYWHSAAFKSRERWNMFFTSMKLLFHSRAWILRTARPEKLWRGHWNRMQRADPSRQSWWAEIPISDKQMHFPVLFVYLPLTNLRDLRLSEADTAGVDLPTLPSVVTWPTSSGWERRARPASWNNTFK